MANLGPSFRPFVSWPFYNQAFVHKWIIQVQIFISSRANRSKAAGMLFFSLSYLGYHLVDLSSSPLAGNLWPRYTGFAEAEPVLLTYKPLNHPYCETLWNNLKQQDHIFTCSIFISFFFLEENHEGYCVYYSIHSVGRGNRRAFSRSHVHWHTILHRAVALLS